MDQAASLDTQWFDGQSPRARAVTLRLDSGELVMRVLAEVHGARQLAADVQLGGRVGGTPDRDGRHEGDRRGAEGEHGIESGEG